MITCPSTVEEATEASHVLRDPQFLRKAPNYGALLCRKLTSHGRIPSSKSLKASPHWQSLECVEGLLSSIGRGLSRTSPFDTLPAHKANRKLLSSKPCDSCPINLSSKRETLRRSLYLVEHQALPRTISSVYFGLSAFRTPCHSRFTHRV